MYSTVGHRGDNKNDRECVHAIDEDSARIIMPLLNLHVSSGKKYNGPRYI